MANVETTTETSASILLNIVSHKNKGWPWCSEHHAKEVLRVWSEEGFRTSALISPESWGTELVGEIDIVCDKMYNEYGHYVEQAKRCNHPAHIEVLQRKVDRRASVLSFLKELKELVERKTSGQIAGPIGTGPHNAHGLLLLNYYFAPKQLLIDV